MTNTALDLAIQHVGGVSELARRLGVRLNRVGNWRKRGVPDAWVVRISRATGGAVPCHLFNPIAFPEVLGSQPGEAPMVHAKDEAA